jgi:hypothetical protein
MEPSPVGTAHVSRRITKENKRGCPTLRDFRRVGTPNVSIFGGISPGEVGSLIPGGTKAGQLPEGERMAASQPRTQQLLRLGQQGSQDELLNLARQTTN